LSRPRRGGAPRPSRAGARPVALFFLGLAIFSPPLLQVFGRGGDIGGLPILVVYLFGAWAGLILLMALHVERRRDAPGRDEERP
jgi:hypothetical protein